MSTTRQPKLAVALLLPIRIMESVRNAQATAKSAHSRRVKAVIKATISVRAFAMPAVITVQAVPLLLIVIPAKRDTTLKAEVVRQPVEAERPLLHQMGLSMSAQQGARHAQSVTPTRRSVLRQRLATVLSPELLLRAIQPAKLVQEPQAKTAILAILVLL